MMANAQRTINRLLASTKPQTSILRVALWHIAVASICFFATFTVPVTASLAVMYIDNDPGGPLFLPIVVMGSFLLAVTTTCLFEITALLGDILRRRYSTPFWLPPSVIFAAAASLSWPLVDFSLNPVVPVVVGAVSTFGFVVYWVAIVNSPFRV